MCTKSIAMIAELAISASPALAQDFEERWQIIPKAYAEPKADNQNAPEPHTQPATAHETNRSPDRVARSFTGRASFYSYSNGNTASGSRFDRDLQTAAHRNLPFGTKVRVTNLANNKSVVVVINDRGPRLLNRVLDLSLAAARTIGLTDRGVAQLRGEVL